MKINEVIQSKRKTLSMTQMQLAEKLDVSDKTVSRWELGTVYPNIDMIPKIAAILGISINELFGDENDIFKSINAQEKRNYEKITILKIFLFILIGCSIISLVLFFSGVKASETSNKNSAILIISAYVIFILADVAFIINRALYSDFYKEKFYINEYKYHDGKTTTIAIYINSFMMGGVLLFSLKFIFLGILIFTVASFINFNFLKKLGYSYKKKALLFLILSGIFYSIFLFVSVISLFSHFGFINMAIPYIFSFFIMNGLACFSLSFFIKNN